MTNPILSFSARRRMRSIRTPILLTVSTLLVAALAYLLAYSPFMQDTFTLNSLRYGVAGYLGIVALLFIVIVLVAPAITAGSISGERERQTLDLLLVTNMGPSRLIWGTLLESFAFLALMLICAMPVLSLLMITGAVTFLQVLSSIGFLLVAALACLSVGIFCSTLFGRTVTATIVSYLTVFAIGLITLLPLYGDVQKLGEIYDAMQSAGVQVYGQTVDYLPVAFIINPGLGLFSLMEAQTGLLSDSLWQVSYTLGNTNSMLRFDVCAYACAGFMLAVSLALILLSALYLRIRPDGSRRKHG